MTSRRTEFAAFVLDLMDFIDEKVREALDNDECPSRGSLRGGRRHPRAADRLRENEVVQANFILVLGNTIERRWAPEWWEDFARMNRAEFEEVARDLVGRLAVLRRIVANDGPAQS
jgi:hypothetical protein